MINRINFRNSLYKLIVLGNVLENKLHKEKMAKLYAFEQLIINTEEVMEQEFMEKQQMEQEQANEEAEVDEVTEDDIKAKIMKLTNVSSSTSEYILQALLAAQEKDNLDAIIEEDRI